MRKPAFVCFVILFFAITPPAFAGPLRAGMAKVVITPEKPIMLAGYAARKSPANGKYHDIHAKALAISDDQENTFVLVTADILGFTNELSEMIAETAKARYGIERGQLMLNASHTHTGPVLRKSLIGAYQLDADQATTIYEYTQFLHDRIIWVIGQALRDKSPARLSRGTGTADFGVNRRQAGPEGIKIGVNPEGVVDHDVPVLQIESSRGALVGVLFGYACHNTTLTDKFNQISGDYAGFAQIEIEKAHPGAIAMFVQGCGADINPNPRSTLELAQQHGAALAAAVEQILQSKLSPVKGTIRSAFDRVMIPFASPPAREEFQARLGQSDIFRKRHAERMLARLERDGRLQSDYPYPIQVLQIGGDLTLIGLAGEVVTDYCLRLKRELGAKGLWVAGYTNEVMAYIPSARMFKEGGYEVDSSMIFYDMPAPWNSALEDIIINKTLDLVQTVGRKR